MMDNIPLGKHTNYVSTYDNELIFPIPRKDNRDALGIPSELPFTGYDIWTGYELSWLNTKGKPQVAIAEFIIPVESSNIVESKSFKLYLNSFNQTRFSDWSAVETRLIADLSVGFGLGIEVKLYDVNSFPVQLQALGLLIDELDVEIDQYSPAPELLSADGSHIVSECLHSHLLKSNCPVTGQPDWASLIIDYEGPEINHESLLKYVISYREHAGFHEHCVETIFTHLNALGRFKKLVVAARYTRRGGLDINPIRSLRKEDVTLYGRMARQ